MKQIKSNPQKLLIFILHYCQKEMETGSCERTSWSSSRAAPLLKFIILFLEKKS